MTTVTDHRPDRTSGLTAQRRLGGDGARLLLRHYLEMVTAMLVGMGALGLVSHDNLALPDRPAIRTIEMGVWMTAPMTAWMRLRGHGRRACTEMAAAMLLPALGALAVLATGKVSDPHALLMAKHVVMFAAMLAVGGSRPVSVVVPGTGSFSPPVALLAPLPHVRQSGCGLARLGSARSTEHPELFRRSLVAMDEVVELELVDLAGIEPG